MFAAAAGDIKAEVSRCEATLAGLGHLGKQLPDRVEDTGVGGGRGAGCVSDCLLIDEDHLIDIFEAADRLVGPGLLTGCMQPAGEGLGEHIEHERGLSRSARAGDGGENTERKGDVEIAERAVPDALHRQPASRLAAGVVFGGHRLGMGPLRGEKRPGDALRIAGQRRRSGLGDDRASFAAAAGAEVDRRVGGVHHIAVVLDDHERVAEIAELAHRPDQPVGVAGMQADRRLVEHIEHAGEPTADLRCQPNPLQLAAGEAAGRPGQVEIVEPNIDEKLDAAAELPQEVGGDRPLLLGEADRGELLGQPPQRHPAPDIERAAKERDGGGHLLQPAAAALRAGHLAHHRINPPPQGDHQPRGLLAGGLHPAELKREAERRHVDPGVARALKERSGGQAREFRKRHVERQAEPSGQGFEHRGGHWAGHVGPEVEGSLAEGRLWIGN